MTATGTAPTIETDGRALARALTTATRVHPTGNARPKNRRVLLETVDGHVDLVVSDFDASTARIRGPLHRSGDRVRILINDHAAKLIGLMAGKRTGIVKNDGRIEVSRREGGHRATAHTDAPREEPDAFAADADAGAPGEPAILQVPTAKLRDALSAGLLGLSDNYPDSKLNAVQLDVRLKERCTLLTSTDGHKLIRTRVPHHPPSTAPDTDDDVSVSLSPNAVQTLLAVLRTPNAADAVDFYYEHPARVAFRHGPVLLKIITLLRAKPARFFEKVIPGTTPHSAEFVLADLIEALQIVDAAAGENRRNTTAVFRLSTGEVLGHCGGTEIVRLRYPPPKLHGNLADRSMTVWPPNLLDVLKHLAATETTVRIGWAGSEDRAPDTARQFRIDYADGLFVAMPARALTGC